MQNHNNERIDILLEYHVHQIPQNINQLYALSTLRMVDVLPEDTLAWMPYYTHHTYKNSKHYV